MDFLGCKCKGCNKKDGPLGCKQSGHMKIALVGNPNVGKSVIFNALSGFYAEVSNYPGTTVDVSKAYMEEGQLIDTPGAYSIGNYTDDEIVTKNILQTVDLVVNVVSAISLERDLFLTQQLIDMDFPMIIVLNQLDEAKSRGIKVDTKKLEESLGIKVIPTIAIRNQGITEVKKNINLESCKLSEEKTPYIKSLYENLEIPRCEKFIKLIEIESPEGDNEKERELIHTQRRDKINFISSRVISKGEATFDLSEYIGNMLFNPIIGVITAITMLYLLYQFLGVFVAGEIVDALSTWVGENYSPWIAELSSKYIPWAPLNEILVGEFGVLTMTIELIIGVLLPLVTSFYLFMAILEDSGYLPRLAALTDRLLSKWGLNGRAVIPILLGFGCTTMGVITSRILGSKKERTIATAILGITVPCSAQIGLIISLIAAVGGLQVWTMYVLTIFTVMVLTGTVLNKVLKGKTTDLLIDIPPMRLPVLKNVVDKLFFRVFNFIMEASPMFIIGSLIISIFKITGILELIHKVLAPIVVVMLKMPEDFANVFIMGMIRRDFGSVEILKLAGMEGGASVLDPVQIFVASVVVTLFVPCLAALVVIFKERGWKEAITLWLSSFTISILVGALLTRVLYFVGF